MSSDPNRFDAIVIGSGIGGLACAAALAKYGKAVLVLERQHVAGGLTQSFSRDGFRWDVGLHYLGEMGPQGEARGVIDWLTGRAIEFEPLGDAYDIVHFPGNFTVPFRRPRAALEHELKSRFPDSAAQIDAFFDALGEAVHAGKALFTRRALSGFLGDVYGLWHKRDILKWWGRTTADVLDSLVSDARLRAVLLAQQGDYGGMEPSVTSFGLHAVVMNHYLNGAWYPVGGAKVFAETLIPAIEEAGGAVRVDTRVQALEIEDGAATGVRIEDGTVLQAPAIFSDIGARNTVGLLPEELRRSAWAQEILSFEPSVCHVTLYLGLDGDIGGHGASASNHWFHESWEINHGTWRAPNELTPAPVLFVSFPSMKDPAQARNDSRRHTAEVVAIIDWEPFKRWSHSTLKERPEEYTAFKSAIAQRLFAQFARHFPELAPMVVFQEVSTPLTMAAYSGAHRGASYGLEVSPRRFLSESLNVRTPVPRLFLTGQDVTSPGVTGAMMGGVLAAASIAHQIYTHLR
ncbi:phytoene desaturase family protein [Paraburkholderia guartelaensis]|uniref:phytoene desaturase family protein n=1 Tax=Paraburkholderia guartelaensis TaxID=2546446 RepID=UPI002AB7668B|nr:NAD(P)/FAD-dependent oxidoreductase [Paraburkholderia guartelaensis]